jgi:hypothetical protein
MADPAVPDTRSALDAIEEASPSGGTPLALSPAPDGASGTSALDAARDLSPLKTSYLKVPSNDHGAGIPWGTEEAFQEDYAKHPIEVPEPFKRIGSAIARGWQSFDPESEAQKEIDQRTLYGRYVAHPLAQIGSIPFRALAATGPGIAQSLMELLGEKGGRDALGGLAALGSPEAAVYPRGLGTAVPIPSPPRSIMERAMTPPIEGQTTLGRAIDLLRHDQNWSNPETPGYHPPGFNPDQPGFIPPGATLPASGPPMSGVPDTLLGRALDQGRPPAEPPPGTPLPVSSPTGTPVSSAGAKTIASQYYKIADGNGGTLTPQFTDKWLDTITKSAEQSDWGKAAAGTNPLVDLIARLQTQRGQPMSLAAMQEVDQAIGKQISRQYGPGGSMADAADLLDIQHKLRDQIDTAGEGDVTGGKAGFDALAPARKAWSQATKMDDLERMKERADQTSNPTTSFKTQVTNFRLNRAKSRGWSDDEIEALKDAANRGVIGGGLHLLGSRLLPLVTGATGGAASGGFGGVIPGWIAGQALGAGVRGIGNAMAARRIANALDVLNRGVPPDPSAPPLP